MAPAPPLDRPVWVDLVRFYGEPDESSVAGFDEPVPGGVLQVGCRVPGLLKRWRRAADGALVRPGQLRGLRLVWFSGPLCGRHVPDLRVHVAHMFATSIMLSMRARSCVV
jgi:hypothetical protein